MTFNLFKKSFAALFILRFCSIYLIGSLVYGIYIKDYHKSDRVDSWTDQVVYQTSCFFKLLGHEASIIENDQRQRKVRVETPFHSLLLNGNYALSVQEGCNGINLFILYLAFIWSLPKGSAFTFKMSLLGIGLIHFLNLMRLSALVWLNTHGQQEYFHFYHKYAFTLGLYFIVLILWYHYLSKDSGKDPKIALR